MYPYTTQEITANGAGVVLIQSESKTTVLGASSV